MILHEMPRSSLFCWTAPSQQCQKMSVNFAIWKDARPLSINEILFSCITVSGKCAWRHSSVALLPLFTRNNLCISITTSDGSTTGVMQAQVFKKHLPKVTTWTSSLSQTLSVHSSHCQTHPSSSKVWSGHM